MDRQQKQKELDDLCREVQKLDKKQMKHKLKGDPEKVFWDTVDDFRDFLIAAICSLNGLQPKDYLKKDGRLKKFKKLSFEKSMLGWNEKGSYDIRGGIFKFRFLTIFLLMFSENIEKICQGKYLNCILPKSGEYENGYFIVSDIYQYTLRFIEGMVSGGPYSNLLLKVNQYTTYINPQWNGDPRQVNQYIREMIFELRKGLKPKGFLEGGYMPDDIAIDTIVKLAYVLCTGDTNLKRLVKFKKIEGIDRYYDVRGILETLGYAIEKKRKTKKRPIMYQAFVKASPDIRTKYDDVNRNGYLRTAIIALNYVEFVCDDKYVTKLIKSII